MDNDCIFCQIIHHMAPAEIVYQDDAVTAFENIRHVAPVHLLIVPNLHITSVDHTHPGDEALLGRLVTLAGELARQRGLSAENGQNGGFGMHAPPI